MILAGIDIGTNTIRLLVAEADDAGDLRELSSGRRITRLGEGLDRTSLLSSESQGRSLAAIMDFVRDARAQGAAVIDAVGTSALRRAANSTAFAAAVRDAAGMSIRIISGEEEARLTLLGALTALRTVPGAAQDADAVVIDIGGGSTEVVARIQGRPRETSLPLGAVYLTERFLLHDPPLAEEIEAVRIAVRTQIDGVTDLSPILSAVQLIGTAGTITTLAAMEQALERYDPERITGFRLSRESISRMIGALSKMPVAERRGLRGLEDGREDIVLAGALVAEGIMERCGSRSLLVSDWGLREGVVLDLADRMRRKERAAGTSLKGSEAG